MIDALWEAWDACTDVCELIDWQAVGMVVMAVIALVAGIGLAAGLSDAWGEESLTLGLLAAGVFVWAPLAVGAAVFRGWRA